ncbi:uncharacterized protein LOC119656819 [Hermetia illucens]|uniref:uncharacterized protein LOC119656819 n=1 Tax=Hermetia illucens TaxID=343691 RepID=UPI0018CC203F|nr:uncharacterized protein LOC119656819 [Hermetia illucens]
MNIKKAATAANIKYETARSILRQYKKNQCALVEQKRGGCRQKKLTDELLTQLETCVESSPSISINEIRHQLSLKGFRVSMSTVNNGLAKLGITLKLAHFELDRVNDPHTIELRKDYAVELSRRCQQTRQKTIFIDECGFNLHLRRHHTQARVVLPTVRGRNVTLIAAMTSDEIIHHKILTNETCNGERFYCFIRELVDKLDPSWQEALVIMDKAKIHQEREVAEIIHTAGLLILFLPPYSPMLNPIEKVFSKIKGYARKGLADVSREHTLQDLIQLGIGNVSSEDCSNFYKDMMMQLPSAAAGKEFH